MENIVTRTDKKGEEITKNISCKLQFNDSARYMESLIYIKSCQQSFCKVIQKIKCKYKCNDKKCETCRIKFTYFEGFLEYAGFKYDLIKSNCLCYNKNY